MSVETENLEYHRHYWYCALAKNLLMPKESAIVMMMTTMVMTTGFDGENERMEARTNN